MQLQSNDKNIIFLQKNRFVGSASNWEGLAHLHILLYIESFHITKILKTLVGCLMPFDIFLPPTAFIHSQLSDDNSSNKCHITLQIHNAIKMCPQSCKNTFFAQFPDSPGKLILLYWYLIWLDFFMFSISWRQMMTKTLTQAGQAK